MDEPTWTNQWEQDYLAGMTDKQRKTFRGFIKHPMGFGAELFESEFCPASMCQRTYLFYSQQMAQDHYKRTHQNPKHWAFIK